MRFALSIIAMILPVFTILLLSRAAGRGEAPAAAPQYPLHRGITATVFWAGEDASTENAYITNVESAWDDDWVTHFGGVDDPDHRHGYHPADFTPLENPFYVALPYTDFSPDGRKPNAMKVVPWAQERQWGRHDSLCKNRWVKITRGAKTTYAQWEDVGPFQHDDVNYVFGSAKPRNRVNHQAGLDVSPAIRDALDLTGIDTVNWQFVDAADVPDGPWKQIVTTRQVSWGDF